MLYQSSDPPGNWWKDNPTPNRQRPNRRRTMYSTGDGSRKVDSSFNSAPLPRRSSTYTETPRPLELLLGKGISCTNNGGDCSIPRTVSTSSNCTESDESVCSEEDLDHQRILAMDAWNEVAEEYHKRVEPFTSEFVPFLLNRTFLAEQVAHKNRDDDVNYLRGKSVLDVATGTGAAALYAVSKGAKVTATDFSEEMLRIAERRACELNIGNYFKPRMADGENLPSGWTDRFDITCSNFGLIYFSDINRGLEEMMRCTKPGGKVCLSAWGRREMKNAFRIFPAAVKLCGFENKWHCGSSVKQSFFLPTKRISAGKELLYKSLTDAGLSNVRVIGPFPRELRLRSAEDYWHRFVLGCPNVKRVVEHFFTEDERALLKKTVIQLVKEEACEYDNIKKESESACSAVLGSECHDVSLSSLSATKISNAKSKVAIADSGATHHLWPDYSAYVSYKRVSNKTVSLADKSTASIRGIGDIAVSLGGKKVLIRNVYHVPSLKAPLYSLGAHRRLPGCGFIGNNDSFQITFPDFSLTVHDEVDSYLQYYPLGKKRTGAFDYIEPRHHSSTPIVSKNGQIILSASAYIAFGTKE